MSDEHEHIEIFAGLAAPFANDEVRSRSQGGREFTYVTARTVMNRLDEVLGPANWWDDYTPMENAIICRLTIRLPDGEALTKSDAGGMSTTSDTSDYEKSGFSDSFKRAAVKFGVGRYLYGDGVPPSIRTALSQGRREDPEPTRSLPAPDRGRDRDRAPDRAPGQATGGLAPRTGKALFAWLREIDEKSGTDVLRNVTEWGKARRYPPRMIAWNGDQVGEAVDYCHALMNPPQSRRGNSRAG